MADITLFLAVTVLSAAALTAVARRVPLFRRSRAATRALVAIALLVSAGLSATGLFRLSKARDFALLAPAVTRVPTAEKLVALTFDDGPTAAHTSEVLDLLAREHVRATFFVTGRECAENPADAHAIAKAGHQLGNHTYDHERVLALSGAEIARQIESTDVEIRKTGYAGPIPFRPPTGKKLLGSGLYLAAHRRSYLMWDLEPDSARIGDSARIAREVVDGVRPGSIVLMHVLYDARQPSRDALVPIIRGLRSKGYRFVTVSELEDARR